MKPMHTEGYLYFLRQAYPELIKEVKDKAICDFGCVSGDQVIALHQAGARLVLGVDMNHKRLGKSQE